MCVRLEDSAFPHSDKGSIGDQRIVGEFMFESGVCTPVCHCECLAHAEGKMLIDSALDFIMCKVAHVRVSQLSAHANGTAVNHSFIAWASSPLLARYYRHASSPSSLSSSSGSRRTQYKTRVTEPAYNIKKEIEETTDLDNCSFSFSNNETINTAQEFLVNAIHSLMWLDRLIVNVV